MPHALPHTLSTIVGRSIHESVRPSIQVRAQLGDFYGGASYTNHTTRAVDMTQVLQRQPLP